MTDKPKGRNDAPRNSPLLAKAPVRALHSSFFLTNEDHSPSLSASSMTPTSAKSKHDSPPSSATRDESPVPQAKLRKLPLKAKYRNPLENHQHLPEHPSWTSVLALEEEVRKLKRDLKTQPQKTTDTQQSEDSKKRPQSRASRDWDSSPGKTDHRCCSQSRESPDPEMKRLANLFVASETALAQVRAERDQLAAKVRELEGRQAASSGLYEVLARFQAENKMLMEEVRRLQSHIKAQGSMKALEKQIADMHTEHQRLRGENSRLREDVETHKDAWRRQQEKLFETACSLREAKKDISQLTEVIRIVRNGAGVSAALILGHMTHPGQYQTIDDTSEVVLLKETADMRAEISSLRQHLSDLYAETTVSLCNPQ